MHSINNKIERLANIAGIAFFVASIQKSALSVFIKKKFHQVFTRTFFLFRTVQLTKLTSERKCQELLSATLRSYLVWKTEEKVAQL